MEHPLKGFWLQRTYHKGLNPFASISDLSFDEAVRFNQDHFKHGMSDEAEPIRSINYINARRDCEAMLFQKAQKAGIRPEHDKPLYFSVHLEKPTLPCNTNFRIVYLPAEIIPAHLISFTYDDSFQHSLIQRGIGIGFSHRLHGRVLNTKQIAAAIKKHGLPSDAFKQGYRIPRYIEAQVWTRKINGFVVVRPQTKNHSPQTIKNNEG